MNENQVPATKSAALNRAAFKSMPTPILLPDQSAFQAIIPGLGVQAEVVETKDFERDNTGEVGLGWES